MKKITILSALVFIAAVSFVSCDSKRQPGKVYMPDMAYSRAYETYAKRDTNIFTMDMAKRGKDMIYYNGSPVPGTIKRGELFPYTLPNDSAGLLASNQVVNPLPPLTAHDSLEAARLFNINCAVCHGDKAEANGPIAAKVGGVKSIIAAAPGYSDGKIFHIITYGQNNMGSYASQLDRKQRWMIVQYIRSIVPKPEGTAAKSDSVTVAKK